MNDEEMMEVFGTTKYSVKSKKDKRSLAVKLSEKGGIGPRFKDVEEKPLKY